MRGVTVVERFVADGKARAWPLGATPADGTLMCFFDGAYQPSFTTRRTGPRTYVNFQEAPMASTLVSIHYTTG